MVEVAQPMNMGQPVNADAISALLEKLAGKRKGQKTTAIGVLKNQAGVYMAIQNTVFEKYKELIQLWLAKFETSYVVDPALLEDEDEDEDENLSGSSYVIDARYLTMTKRKLSERSGYHAEMIIVSAMMSANVWKPKNTKALRKLIKEAGGGVICADAPCCFHCANMLDAIGISYPGDRGKRGLTAWWNPINDTVYQNGSEEFKSDIPGE